MDTKPLELEALNEIESKVARYGYKYSRMNFDEDGGDFYIIRKDASNMLKYLRCQSKGRSVYPNPSNVIIPKRYVEDDFLVFVYVKPEDLDGVETYMYTAEDIKGVWEKGEKSYKLYLSKNFIDDKAHDKYIFKKDRAAIIETLLMTVGNQQDVDSVKAMTEIDFYFKMWRMTGELPSIEYLRVIYNNNILDVIGTKKFVFLICALIIQNQDDDMSLSVDWAFGSLKTMTADGQQFADCISHKRYMSNVAITYYKTWVEELVSGDGTLQGYHLHMADDEESLDSYVKREI